MGIDDWVQSIMQQKARNAAAAVENARLRTVDLGAIVPGLVQSIIQRNPTSLALGLAGELSRALSGSDKNIAASMQGLSELLPTSWGKPTAGENPLVSGMRSLGLTRPISPREAEAKKKVAEYEKKPGWKQSLSIDPRTGEETRGFTFDPYGEEEMKLKRQMLDLRMREADSKKSDDILYGPLNEATKLQMNQFGKFNTYEDWARTLSGANRNFPIRTLTKEGKTATDYLTNQDVMNQMGVNMTRLKYEAGKYYQKLGAGILTPSKKYSMDESLLNTPSGAADYELGVYGR
jgi:hypothetical protein